MKTFDPQLETNNIINFIKNYYEKNNISGVILGISGGKDSAVVAALFTKALGAENVIGVTMPCHSNLEDMNDAKVLSEYYGFELINFDLTNVFDMFKNELNSLKEYNVEQTRNSDINLKPRLRMSTLYYLAALYTEIRGEKYIVAGTSNKSELYVGYFTKGGDSVHDIATIANYTVEEVIKIGEYLKVPEKVLYKTPSDGLSNMSDEDKLGIKYSDIAKYLNNEEIDSDTKIKIEKLHNANSHKFNIPTYKRNED